MNKSNKSTIVDKQENPVELCEGCNVREPFEHRCHGEKCDCDDLMCQVKQGKLSSEKAAEIAINALKDK